MKAWEQEKRVAVPKCDPYSHTMDFHTITSFTDLEKVNFPFFEPKVGQTKKAYPHTIDLLIVPGLVFDYEGYRIGYGGGYFDRYLQHFSNAAVSLALACQVIPQIERESFDQKVNKLITEGMSYEFE